MRHTVGNTDIHGYIDGDCNGYGDCNGDRYIDDHRFGNTDKHVYTWCRRNTRTMGDGNAGTAFEVSCWRNN